MGLNAQYDEPSANRKKKRAGEISDEVVKSWQHLLRGFWWSGLRLEEALNLWWDFRNDRLSVDWSGKYVMLHIPAELEKGHQDRLYPVAPEFAEFLMVTSEAERTGPVFSPTPLRPERSQRLGKQQVGRVISRIGESAYVKVDTDSKGKVKFASAHDLRRSFGERWSLLRVMPQTLIVLMRHDSIETTLKYYVGHNAETTAEALYAAVSGNSPQFSADSLSRKFDVSL